MSFLQARSLTVENAKRSRTLFAALYLYNSDTKPNETKDTVVNSWDSLARDFANRNPDFSQLLDIETMNKVDAAGNEFRDFLESKNAVVQSIPGMLSGR